MSVKRGLCIFSIFILIFFLSPCKGETDYLECFSTDCAEYSHAKGCTNCSQKLLNKSTRTLWATYMDKLSQNSVEYRKFRDRPRCCVMKGDLNGPKYCVALQTKVNSQNFGVEFKYYQLSCSSNEDRNRFPEGGAAICHTDEKNGGCCQKNHCNLGMSHVNSVAKEIAKKRVQEPGRQSSLTEMKLVVVIIGVSAGIIIILLLIVVVYLYRKSNQGSRTLDTKDPVRVPHEQWITQTDGSTNEWEFTESGSGSGMPLLVPRTMARQIERLSLIGQGRYGEVWKGRWRDTFVAIKIFSSRDERSWFRETEMYRTVCLRHENILGFISADNKDNGQQTQLWLITDYHPNGSLFDFLQINTVSLIRMFRMMYSIISGLQHLHGQISGLQGKPAIAHRDLKSRNILVKSDYTCCIADLGLAVKQDNDTGLIDFPDNPTRVGTNRYMAPEVLSETIMKTIDAYKQADLYSLGLIFWELVRRCDEENDGLTPELYSLPYQDMYPTDPSVEEMTSIVCEQGIRPPISQKWEMHSRLATLIRVMEECWHADPTVRPPALRIQKTVKNLSSVDDEVIA